MRSILDACFTRRPAGIKTALQYFNQLLVWEQYILRVFHSRSSLIPIEFEPQRAIQLANKLLAFRKAQSFALKALFSTFF